MFSYSGGEELNSTEAHHCCVPKPDVVVFFGSHILELLRFSTVANGRLVGVWQVQYLVGIPEARLSVLSSARAHWRYG